MAKHDATIALTPTDLTKAGAEVTVNADGARLGVATITRGGVTFRPAHARRSKKLSWTQLAAIIEEQGVNA